jgi:hypothetical protein
VVPRELSLLFPPLFEGFSAAHKLQTIHYRCAQNAPLARLSCADKSKEPFTAHRYSADQ